MPTPAIDYLRELVALSGPSGTEEDVIRAIARWVRPLVDTLALDALGNLIAVRHGATSTARRCAIAVHMDEIGFRVRKIEDNGYLRFEKVGGSDNRVLLAQRVWIRTARGRLLGVIGTKSAHLLTDADRSTVPPHTAQYIDIGARDKADAERMGVALGDPAGFVGELAELGLASGRYTAHALDDRAGCAVLLAVLDELRERPLPVTIIALFTVQEEVGLRGAQAAIRGQAADVGLAIDTTALDDTPETATYTLCLGSGPAVKVMDFSTLAHASALQGNQARVAVGGSAGGNLAAVVALMARDRGGPPLMFHLLVYPSTDRRMGSASIEENAESYGLTKRDLLRFQRHYLAREADMANPLASPLLAPDLSGLPPALIITAEYDPLRTRASATVSGYTRRASRPRSRAITA